MKRAKHSAWRASPAWSRSGWPRPAADQLLTGAIASASGQKLGRRARCRPSWKARRSPPASTPTQNGNYYFPPLPDGKYSVWAQALGFETAKGAVDLTATTSTRISRSQPITDAEARYRQLPPRTDGRGAARGDAGRRPHQEDLHQRLHRLPFAGLPAAVQVRRSRLEQDHQPDEGRSRQRRVSRAERQGRARSSSTTRSSSRPISRARAARAKPR